MKVYRITILVLVWLLPGLVFGGAGADEVIRNINNQLMNRATAKAVLTLAGGKIKEIKRLDLLMEVAKGGETITGEIFEPANKRGTVKITWTGGRASIKHIETGRGKKRNVSAHPGYSFLGTGFAYADIKVLEDGSYKYGWMGDDKLQALASDSEATYRKKVLGVKRMDDGLWVITRVEYYNSRGRKLKTKENLDFVNAYGGWRPSRIVVKKVKSRYTTTLELDWGSRTVFD